MTMILLIITILVYVCHNQQLYQVNTLNWFLQNFLKQQTMSEYQKQQIKYFQQKMSCISFQSTIQTYPFIKQNMDQFRLANLLQAGGCQHPIGPVTFLIIDNEIYKFGYHKEHQRMKLLEQILNNSKEQHPLPNAYFVIHLQDQMISRSIPVQKKLICHKTPLIMYNKNCFVQFQNTKFIISDPYITQNGFDNFLKHLHQKQKTIRWEDKISKLYFRGFPSTPALTPNFIVTLINQKTSEQELYKWFHRGVFALLSVKYPDVIDAKLTGKNYYSQEIKRRLEDNQEIYSAQQNFIQALKFKYLLSADGYGSAWKRIPLILHSNSLLFKVKSQKIQYFYDKMIPQIHYIQINNDLSNLFTKMNQMNENPEKAKQIIANANKLASEYLSPQYISFIIFDTLKKYSRIQKVSLSQNEKQKLRQGIAINQILIQRYYSMLKFCQKLIIVEVFLALVFFIIKIVKKSLRRGSKSKQKQQQQKIVCLQQPQY